jgi:hypothetical protein
MVMMQLIVANAMKAVKKVLLCMAAILYTRNPITYPDENIE